jgi:ABC-type transporter Mla maintaining outer membrane lipid asymmetry permease subunit MlaE
LNIFQPVGKAFLGFLEAAGRLALFAIVSVSHCVRPPIYPRLIGRQMIEIGYYSLPVVGLTTLFSGMVLALQSYTGFARFSAESAVPNVVVLSMTRELGPVLAVINDPRVGSGSGRADGGGPGRRRDGRRNWHHARHRTNRRANHIVN